MSCKRRLLVRKRCDEIWTTLVFGSRNAAIKIHKLIKRIRGCEDEMVLMMLGFTITASEADATCVSVSSCTVFLMLPGLGHWFPHAMERCSELKHQSCDADVWSSPIRSLRGPNGWIRVSRSHRGESRWMRHALSQKLHAAVGNK